ncbi:MAG: response regulator [Halobacteriovoraceae bacterium]|nr:response regulator [Halobacteriovoraceae bacterium]
MLNFSYPLSVVLLDDDPMIHAIMKKYLEGLEQYELTCFTSPKDALDFIKSKGAEIAVIDINLPDIKGPEVLRQINAFGHGTESIIITANDDMLNFTTCYSQKANSFLFKPLKKESVLEEIERCRENLLRWNGVFIEMMKRKKERKSL